MLGPTFSALALPRHWCLAQQQIREAIEFHIEGMRQHGETVPDPSIEAGTVSVSTQCQRRRDSGENAETILGRISKHAQGDAALALT